MNSSFHHLHPFMISISSSPHRHPLQSSSSLHHEELRLQFPSRPPAVSVDALCVCWWHLHTLSACKNPNIVTNPRLWMKSRRSNPSLRFQLQVLHPSSQADQNPVMHQSSAPLLPPPAKSRLRQPRTATGGEQRCPGGKGKEATGAEAGDPQTLSRLRLFLSQKSTSAASRLLKRPPDPERTGSSRLPKPKIWGGLDQTVRWLNYW